MVEGLFWLFCLAGCGDTETESKTQEVEAKESDVWVTLELYSEQPKILCLLKKVFKKWNKRTPREEEL